MIYFDNAATGGFKPRAVTDAAESVIRYLSANPGRSAHRLAFTGAQTVFDCRQIVSKFFNACPERVIFTKNCTEALNTAIFGTINKGGHVITTTYEHNSVLRPLVTLQRKGLISLDIVCPTHDKTITKAIEEKVRPDTYLIATTALSNVTGETLPLKEIGAVAKKTNTLFLVDGAQGGGHIPIDMKEMNISLLALAGHKGLYGIMGSGLLILSDNAEVEPILYGGTGNESFNLSQPRCYPERLEAGTVNLPAIAALLEGVRFIKSNLKNFGNHLSTATERLIKNLSIIPNVTVFSQKNHAGIVSFSVKNKASTEVADLLNEKYDVAVRGGYHCAPLMHKYLGTEKDGLVRASLAVQNSTREIDFFIRAIKEIASD